MMAAIGFAMVFLLGVFLLIAGCALFYGTLLVGEQLSDRLTALFIIVVGGAITYYACLHAPFAIVARGVA